MCVWGGGVGNKKRKENTGSKQIRPFTSKVAKVGYAKRDFKHNATNADM